jgi:hypothetical protein
MERAGERIVVLVPVGVLDSASYMPLRTALVKAASEDAAAILVDVAGLIVPAPSAWCVLTSAQWMVSAWPGVPICCIAGSTATRCALQARGITRYVSVFASRQDAVAAIGADDVKRRYRLRAGRDLPRCPGTQGIGREMIRRCLVDWSHPEYLPAAEAVATELIGNVLRHTRSAPRLRLELHDDLLSIAVGDDSSSPAVRREPASGSFRFSGLGVVSLLARTWGSHPVGGGKVVWAVIGAPTGRSH